VYLAVADGDGNMVSFIQSNYTGFGSGGVVPGTGIALLNRGFELPWMSRPAFFAAGASPERTVLWQLGNGTNGTNVNMIS